MFLNYQISGFLNRLCYKSNSVNQRHFLRKVNLKIFSWAGSKWLSTNLGCQILKTTCQEQTLHKIFFTEEILNGKLYFFCIVKGVNQPNKLHIDRDLKLVSAIFYQIFIFSLNDSTSKTMKNVSYFI